MNVVIYARYSSDKQREESIEGQLKVCYDYAEKMGYNVIGEYIDRAMSAKTDNRPNFQKMVKDSNKKHFQGILVYQIDRFSRNRIDTAAYKAILAKNGVKVYSANENITDDASGALLESVLEGIAEYYSKELAEKVTRGHAINAEKCLSNGGITPLGYRRAENKRYVIDEKNAPIVKEIFTKYANGERIVDICADLNERNIKSAKGAKFNKNSMHTILTNRKYLGIYIYDGKEKVGGMPQIIDEDLFNKVADRMEMNKKAPARARAREEYLLTTKLFCGYCKEMMVGHSSNKTSKKGIRYNYYKCKNTGAGKPCKKKMVMKNYIENIVIEECCKLLAPDKIKMIAERCEKVSRSYDDTTELTRLKKLLKEANEAKENQMKSLRQCKNDSVRDMIFNDLEAIASEISALEKQIEIEKARHHILTKEQVSKFLTLLAKGDPSDIVYRRALIKVFVNKIFLYDDKFTITFNSGDEEVTITDKMLSEIQNNTADKRVCLLTKSSHHHVGAKFALLRFLSYLYIR